MEQKKLIKQAGKNAVYFILSKGVAFLSPLLFVRFVTLEEYGVVEFSYSTGSVIAVLALLGLSGAYPYFILKKGETAKEQVFLLYGFPVAFVGFIASVLRVFAILPQRWYLVILFTLIFALQRLYSSILKSKDKGYIGVLLDGGYYFVLTAVILIAWSVGAASPVSMLEILMASYLTLLSAFYFWRFQKIKTSDIGNLISEIPPILHFSLKLVLSGVIIYWLTSSARIYIRYLMGFEQVGIYSFYFRIAGISIAIYLFFYIAFFRQLYMADRKRMDTYYSILMGIVLLGVMACFVAMPLLMRFFANNYEFSNNCLYILIALQMPIWTGISLLEGIISRENQVSKMNYQLGFCTLLFPIVLGLLKSEMTLTLFTILNTGMFCCAFMLQILILKRAGIYLKKCLAVNIVLGVVSVIIYLTY